MFDEFIGELRRLELPVSVPIDMPLDDKRATSVANVRTMMIVTNSNSRMLKRNMGGS